MDRDLSGNVSGIGGYEATSPEDREAIERLAHHYDTLRREVHLPYLDGVVLNKYVVKPVLEFSTPVASTSPSDDKADVATGTVRYVNSQEAKNARELAVNRLVTLVTLVTDHKQRTLEVLEAVAKREAALKALHSALSSTTPQANAANESAAEGNGDPPAAEPTSLSPVETAAVIQHHVFHLQKASLAVVEKIVMWRDGLTMPHPFMVGNDNYLLKMMSDVALLATDRALEEAVPMQSLFFMYPLCSNLPSLSRFAEDPIKANFGNKAANKSHGYGPVADSSYTRRLQAAEGTLLGEVETQTKLLQQLVDLCKKNRFLPVLNIKKIYPPSLGKGVSGAASGSGAGGAILRGIPLMQPELQQRLESTLLHALDVLRRPAFRAAYDEAVRERESKKQQQ